MTTRAEAWDAPAGAGVLAVNIAGSFAIGLFLTLSHERFGWGPELRLLVATGFLGAFTTFSALSWETYRMLEMRDVAAAALNICASVVVGLLAVYGGAQAARAF